MTVINLRRERAIRRPTAYTSVDEAMAAAQAELLKAKDLADSALLLDSADVLDHLATIHGIIRACQHHLARHTTAAPRTGTETNA